MKVISDSSPLRALSVQQAIIEAELDPERLQAYVDSVLSEETYWFPVRHHSPAVAGYVEEAILTRKPKLVLIEGPHEANDLIPYITDKRTRPPIALYSSYRDDDNVLGLAGIASPSEDVPSRFACWYPLLTYSPEYIALKAARQIKADAMFIDLPHHGLLKPAQKDDAEEDATEQTSPSPSDTPEHDTDHLIMECLFYQKLVEVTGFKTWNETWDTLFEISREDRDVASFRREMAYFCAAARLTADPSRMAAEGTLAREQFMFQTIEEERERRGLNPEEIMVVCGGFHLFMDREACEKPPLPKGTIYTTVAPYSFFRISELSGYAAGNRAPNYYQMLWDIGKNRPHQEAFIHYVVKVLKRGRQEGEVLSSADAIAVMQTATMLANLRGRSVPVLDDLHDAFITCCCKGDPQEEGHYLRKAIHAIDIGNRMGRVTPELTRLPIVNDFHTQLEELELGEVLEKEKHVKLTLDKREEKDARRSIFLHRLDFLKIPLGERTESPDMSKGLLFRERWVIRWSPRVEHALIEKNLYGDTIENAALTLFKENLSKGQHAAGIVSHHLIRAIDMNFPDLVARVEDICGYAIDNDPDFVSLSHALTHLITLNHHALFQNLKRERICELIIRAFDRACFALLNAALSPDDLQTEVVSALLALAEALRISGRGDMPALDRHLFSQHLRQVAAVSPSHHLRGAFWGTLSELREITPEQLADQVARYAKEPPDLMICAGEFLEGLMSVSRTSIMLGASHFVRAIDTLLAVADWEAFLIMLPKMRSAFHHLHAKQLDQVAQAVAEQYGLAQAAELTGPLETSVAAGVLIARIDAQVAEIMGKWHF